MLAAREPRGPVALVAVALNVVLGGTVGWLVRALLLAQRSGPDSDSGAVQFGTSGTASAAVSALAAFVLALAANAVAGRATDSLNWRRALTWSVVASTVALAVGLLGVVQRLLR